MESDIGYDAAKAALDWQVEMGADEAIGEAPVNRYELPKSGPGAAGKQDAGKQDAGKQQAGKQDAWKQDGVRPSAPASAPQSAAASTAQAQGAAEQEEAVAEARRAAAAAPDLASLAAAMAGYDRCELKRGARQLVFADGDPAARLMIIGEAPGREEDNLGRPFVGRAGQLLDRMLAAIGMGRDNAEAPVYITNVLPWRPPQNRDPTPQEIAMLLPFLERHVALVDPEVLILMGNTACQAALGKRGIMRLRGTWAQAFGRPAMPMFHPAYLLRTPAAKREAWADLLAVKAKLAEGG